jgi:hypothetical protein
MVPDPDQGGPKTYGSDGSGFASGSPTLNVTTFYLSDQNILVVIVLEHRILLDIMPKVVKIIV